MNPIPNTPVLLRRMTLASLVRSTLRIGPFRLPWLLWRKSVKRVRYWRMLTERVHGSASFCGSRGKLELPATQQERIIARADAMLRDENTFFSFPYHLKEIERPWEFDPIENKYWPRRHYTESKLHAADTPRDAKIVWEINRFKDLPTLGQAFVLTGEEKYAEEAIRRMIFWVDGNPFAATVNWASALEISIRLISWTATIALLRSASAFLIPNEEEHKLSESIYQQARYLAADLSTDKVVPTNHLIGEAAGLFLVASLWKFPRSKQHARRAKRILMREILRQTFKDGVTREASSWYHQFVTDFFDLADRVGATNGNPLDELFRKRLADMKAFLEMMTVHGEVVRYGDADDGWALWFEGDRDEWKSTLFGPPPTTATRPSINYYNYAHLVAAHLKSAFLFLRAGEFGMGGAGFSSHAHDDFLSPIVYLAGTPVLADPGTFVYNGNPEARNRFRTADAHSGIIIGAGTGAEPRRSFGWNRIRPDANVLEAAFTVREAIVTAYCSQWPEHRRMIKVNQTIALIVDRFDKHPGADCTWHFHLDPQWNLSEERPGCYRFHNAAGQTLIVTLRGKIDKLELLPYEFSPSYGVQMSATMLRFSARNPSGVYAVLLAIEPPCEVI